MTILKSPIRSTLRSPLRGPLESSFGDTNPLSISAPSFAIIVADQPHAISAANSNLVVASDVDAGGGDFDFTITLTGDGSPTMTLAGTVGLVFDPVSADNDGTTDSTMTFACTVAEFNTAMDGATLQGGTDGSTSIAYSMTDGTNTANATQVATISASAYVPSLDFSDGRNSMYL